jgi:hypothetical protein
VLAIFPISEEIGGFEAFLGQHAEADKHFMLQRVSIYR